MGCLARSVALLALVLAIAVAARRLLEPAASIPPPGGGEKDTLVDAVRWRSRESPGKGPETVVYVHGFLSSSATWKGVLQSAAGGRPAIAVDLPGSGYSDRPWPCDYTVTGQAAALLRYLEVRRVNRAVFVGNSLGGAVSLVAAAARPKLVAALVLVGSASPHTRVPWGFRTLRTPVVGELQIELLTRPVVEYMLRNRLYARAERVSEGTVDEWWEPIRVAGTRRAALEAIRSSPRGYEGLLSKIHVPTLVLWGKGDRLLQLSEALALAEGIESSKLVVLPDAGHLPQEEAPEAFSRAVSSFLKEQSGG